MDKDSIIRLENVSKIYKSGELELAVLKNINLSIAKGSFTVILGPSGSGKSTLLHIVSNLDVPTSGKVYLAGKDVSGLSDNELSEVRGKKIGFVFQQFNLLSHYTALENTILPLAFQKISDSEAQERGRKLLESVGLGHRMDHRPTQLSGGEQQRVAIARALVFDPEILVADEPTGNVDSKTGEQLMKILTDLNKKQHRTIIVVTHDKETARYADKVINIKDGELV